MLTVLSLGAGVQSSTLALMAAAGETPMPDAAIFADTQAEPQSVYRWLDWLEQQLPFPVYRVTGGNLREAALRVRVSAKGKRYATKKLPVYTLNADGSHGMVRQRNCTYDFKIIPIRRLVKRLAGIKRGQREVCVEQWIGISRDEAQRMRDSRDPWVRHRYPLIEMGMTRTACLLWMEQRGYPTPPRSSCTFCPFHSDTEWRRLRDNEPEAFADAVVFERALQAARSESERVTYLHRSRVPLDTVDFSTLEDLGQQRLWGNECEGMCGV